MSENKGQIVDFTVKLKTFDNKPIYLDDDDKKVGIEATLKDVCVGALLSKDSSGMNDAIIKLKQFELARKIYASDKAIELTSEECQLILKCSNLIYTPNIYGRICEHIK